MGVPADVKVGFFLLQKVFHLGHIMTGISSYVGHVDVNVFNVEVEILGILQPHDMVVDIAVKLVLGRYVKKQGEKV